MRDDLRTQEETLLKTGRIIPVHSCGSHTIEMTIADRKQATDEDTNL